jgi:hypothetical protein
VVDVGGPRRDGRLVVAAAGRLALLAADGTATPFATGDDGYAGSTDGEIYFVVTPGLPTDPSGCAFVQDDVYILDLASPPGVARVDAAGRATRAATLPGLDTLNGIAFDTTGDFGYRLLVTGSGQNRTVVSAIDCQGAVTTIADPAPTVEGGLAVAPASFGPFAGDLIAPDENSGQLWAIAPDGTSHQLARPNLPAGGDTGVESLGFVPTPFGSGFAYLADRATANNPFPGTDSILRLSFDALRAAGVQGGDLLVATEGGGATVAVHCDTASCTVVPVADGPAGGRTGHIEGHLLLAPAIAD